MRKKHQHKDHEEHIDESWLIPYADLLTLLLALFIVLFSMSSIDGAKFKQVANSFTSALDSGNGIMEYPSSVPPNKVEPTSKDNEMIKPADEEKKSLQEIQAKVNNYIASQNLTGKLKTSLTEEGLLIIILDDVLFDSGVAEIRAADSQLVAEISQLLIMDTPKNISISGHTDNIPIKNNEFDSNWDLSVMRAVNFMKALLENPRLNPALFSARGYGEYKPVASNTTAAGRMKNRRVEILIVPNESKND